MSDRLADNASIARFKYRVLLALARRTNTTAAYDNLQFVEVTADRQVTLTGPLSNEAPPTRQELAAVRGAPARQEAIRLWADDLIADQARSSPVVAAAIIGLIREQPGINTRRQVVDKWLEYLADYGITPDTDIEDRR